MEEISFKCCIKQDTEFATGSCWQDSDTVLLLVQTQKIRMRPPRPGAASVHTQLLLSDAERPFWAYRTRSLQGQAVFALPPS